MGFFDKGVVFVNDGKKPSRYGFPAFTVTCTRNKVRINGEGSNLLGVGNRENLIIVSDGAKDPTFAIMKGYPVLDDSGNAYRVADRITKSERKALIEAEDVYTDNAGKVHANVPNVDKLHGFRIAITNGNASKGDKGITLEGTDAISWSKLGGDTAINKVFKILPSPEVVEYDGENRDIYILEHVSDDKPFVKGSTDETPENENGVTDLDLEEVEEEEVEEEVEE